MGCQSSSTVRHDLIKDKLILGYWAAPAVGQPARYILELASAPYEEKLYTKETAASWFGQDKLNLGLDYPNLPFLIHGDFKITESQNIVNYAIDVTNQTSLYGEGAQKFQIGNVRFVCADLIPSVFGASQKTGQEQTDSLNKDIIPKFQQLQTFLKKRTQLFEKLTVADVYFYVATSNFKALFKDQYAPFAADFDPALAAFDALPQIKAYHASDRYAKLQKLG